MKPVAAIAFALLLGVILPGCASSDLGKIGPDYSANPTYQAGQVSQMHSNIQRGTF